MASINVTFVQVDGVEKTLQNVPIGESLMEAARAAGVEGILGDCGGGCACATCHGYVDPPWEAAVGKPDEVELGALDMVSDVQQSNSRLSCQIVARPELDGLRLVGAPVSK
jgi:2Fe-2S ferredoxin